ncbi:germination protein, Ger(x)C family [Paenibacillus curdlanolyticus YK9]|uniref:Germination protein, Ger(X)C family n=1 Tax=Paenibacillus curdlanolyticus YK9 TaxID=717606 RepID=E0I755_9BACL|nr:Ger(x)C family spore germination protein [Paenibacillus curdlanolyticus]EFM11871.1 germination protein, Ger(x)C family [Paenibacillus curdlanolyticus YK9]
MSTRLIGRAIRLVLAAAAMLTLSGCWDEVDLQEVGYVTALGIDYVDGKYELYGEMIGFNTVAKTEGVQPAEGANTWTGRAEGKTLLVAFQQLMRSTQYQLSLDHLKSLVINERAIGMLDEVLDGLNRQRASRYTVWVFGTKEPFDKLFGADTIFNRSPLVSVLYSPKLIFEQDSSYLPLNMQMFIQQLDEPSYTTILPNISTNNVAWKQQQKSLNLYQLNGVYTFKNRHFNSYIEDTAINGLRWIQPKFSHSIVGFQVGDGRVSISVDKVKWKIKDGGGNPRRFRVELALRIHTIEIEGNHTSKEIEAATNQFVKNEVKKTFLAGLEKKADLLQLRLHLYRYHNAYWKKYASDDNWLPGADDVTIEVRSVLKNSGKYDLRD